MLFKVEFTQEHIANYYGSKLVEANSQEEAEAQVAEEYAAGELEYLFDKESDETYFDVALVQAVTE